MLIQDQFGIIQNVTYYPNQFLGFCRFLQQDTSWILIPRGLLVIDFFCCLQPPHSDLNWSIMSNIKYNPGQPIQKPGFWLSSRPFCIRTTFIWVHQGPLVMVLIFFLILVTTQNPQIWNQKPILPKFMELGGSK